MGQDETFPTPVLVTGATSLVGGFLLARLAAEGVDAAALSRRPPTKRPDGGEGQWIEADLSWPDVAACLPFARTVFSLSPIWCLPQALAALKGRGMSRLVAFSSTSRFTKADSPEASERETAEKLADGEEATIAFCQANDVAWTILRPTLIYAEGRDGNVSRLAGLIRKLGVLPLSGAGAGLRQPVHADDLAVGAIAAARSSAARNRAYDLTGAETLTYRVMAERVFEGLGRTPRIVSLPPALWSLGLKLAAPLLPGATAAMGARMEADLVFESAEAVRDFGWAPRAFHPDFRP
jgi:nucleoside-diphosphate-sugar epimerase